MAKSTTEQMRAALAQRKPVHAAKGGLQRANAARAGEENRIRGSNPNIFIGRTSPMWDRGHAQAAKEMELAGGTPEKIWQQHGTFRGPGGNWRQEINDRPAEFNTAEGISRKYEAGKQANNDLKETIKESLAREKHTPDMFPKHSAQARKDIKQKIDTGVANLHGNYGLSSDPQYMGNFAHHALDHEQLFKAYPELRRTVVQQGQNMGPHALGAQSPNQIDIYKAGLKKDPRSTMLHEMQHGIQDIENWPSGGSPDQGGMDRYLRLGGEAEARAVQARKDMTQAERQAEFPMASYDVPPRKLINVDKQGFPYEPKMAAGGTVKQNKQAFLAPSKIKDVYYHGTMHDTDHGPKRDALINSGGIREFKPGEHQLMFASPSKEFANSYAFPGDKKSAHPAAVYPVHIHTKNPWDYENSEHVKNVLNEISPEHMADHEKWGGTKDDLHKRLATGNWSLIERPMILEAAQRLGHDAMHMEEGGHKNIGVFHPRQFKSATGNRGTYDPSNPDITMAKGGTVKKYAMGGSTAPLPTNQMHHSLGHSVGENADIRSIGVDEAPNMPIKTFVMPPGGEDLPPGKMPGGALPTGGVNFQPGTPGALGQAPQQPAPGQQPQGAPQQGAPQQAPGQPAPNQPPSNILNMTHQGQAMSAMTPPGQLHPAMQPQGLAKGGQPKNDKPSLAKIFSEAIGHHLGLEPSEHAANSVRAAHSIGEIIGFSEHNGRPKDILGQNEKAHGAKLPDGRGIEIAGVALSPDGEGPTPGHIAKTHALLQDPHSFAVKLHDEIETAKQQAAHNGNHLGVRLNVMSNIKPQVHKAIINAHPDVSFYDYSHHNADAVAPNHHVTYVSNGHGHADTNWKQMRERLHKGDNVAMSFSHSEHLPKHVHDEATNKMHPVIDGDAHDFRPLDGRGVVVGHRNKKAEGSSETAHEDSHGFFTHHDPDIHGSISVVKRHAFDKV